MSRKIHVAPGKVSRSAAGMGALIAILFLVFGVVFFWVVMDDTPPSEEGLRLLQGAFLVIWVVACLSIAFVNLRIFIKGRTPAEAAFLELEEDGPNDAPAAEGDFDVRLRKLEGLHRDGLITEEEYRRKRAEIVGEKW